MPQSVKRI